MALTEIKATARPQAGKGAARLVRREGKVPGVIYGDKQPAVIVALDSRELAKVIGKGKFLTTLYTLDVDGTKSRVIPRDVQLDPVKDFAIHVDFQRVGPGGKIRVNVPCKFVNEGASPGLKRGGALNIVRHDVEVICSADAIPPYFEFDLTGLEIGRSIHISATTLPDGVKTVIKDRDFTVATIAGAKAQEEEVKPTAGAEAAAVTAAAGDAKAAAGAAGGKGAAPAAGGKAAAPAAKAAAKPAAKK
jgi:large subunit ribosomal protein L25